MEGRGSTEIAHDSFVASFFTPITDTSAEGGENNRVQSTPPVPWPTLSLERSESELDAGVIMARFLEVMTGPGLRVKKLHHKSSGKAASTRVLQYNASEKCLNWDSHKILSPGGRKIPIKDIDGVERTGTTVTIEHQGKFNSFEALRFDVAAVLHSGLEHLVADERNRGLTAPNDGVALSGRE